MLSIEQTRDAAASTLGDTEGVLLNPEGPTRELDDYVAWTFNSEEYWATRDPMKGLVGNCALAVDRTDGSVHELPTGLPIEDGLDELRSRRNRTAGRERPASSRYRGLSRACHRRSGTSSSVSSCSIRVRISSRIGRTASIPFPAGSSSFQSS